jgi:hypothetical protein
LLLPLGLLPVVFAEPRLFLLALGAGARLNFGIAPAVANTHWHHWHDAAAKLPKCFFGHAVRHDRSKSGSWIAFTISGRSRVNPIKLAGNQLDLGRNDLGAMLSWKNDPVWHHHRRDRIRATLGQGGCGPRL